MTTMKKAGTYESGRKPRRRSSELVESIDVTALWFSSRFPSGTKVIRISIAIRRIIKVLGKWVMDHHHRHLVHKRHDNATKWRVCWRRLEMGKTKRVDRRRGSTHDVFIYPRVNKSLFWLNACPSCFVFWHAR